MRLPWPFLHSFDLPPNYVLKFRFPSQRKPSNWCLNKPWNNLKRILNRRYLLVKSLWSESPYRNKSIYWTWIRDIRIQHKPRNQVLLLWLTPIHPNASRIWRNLGCLSKQPRFVKIPLITSYRKEWNQQFWYRYSYSASLWFHSTRWIWKGE